MSVPNDGIYKSIEATVDKRRSANWSFSAGFGYTWTDDYPLGYPNTPNGPFNEDRRIYSFKGSLSYTMPWEILLSSSFQLQAGANYARTLSVAAPASCACTFSQANLPVTPYDQDTQDTVSLFDVRVDKAIRIRNLAKVHVFLDTYNLFNNYAAEAVNPATGPLFQRPTAILSPRTVKAGFRVTW